MDVSLFWRALRLLVVWAALIAASLFFSSSVFANEDSYYWYSTSRAYSGSEQVVGNRYPSSGAICSAIAAAYTSSSWSVTGSFTTRKTDINWDCTLNFVDSKGSTSSTVVSIYRAGSECSVGDYDPSIGSCVAPEPDACEAKRDTSEPFSRHGIAPDNYVNLWTGTDGRKWQQPAQSACFTGCVVDTIDQKCVTRVSGSYVCRGMARYTGDQCGDGGGSAPVESTTDPLPEPTVTQKTEPCVYVETATGFQCQSMATWEHEGQHCGEYNGVPTCTGQKQPRANEVVVDTEITTEQQPDGSTVTTKTDTATTTDCKGMDDCTTDKTVTVTKTKTDANGNTTTTEQQCTGSACPGANGPGGEGDGEGEDGGEFSGPELVEQGSFGDALEGFSERVGNAPLIAAVSRLGIHGSGSCSFPSFTVPMLGTLSFDAMCANAASWFAPLYTLMLALWAFVAVRTFMEA